ncbi:cryptochrome/photolyase family protein [Polynucleobacter necessarius]|uniref:cryptochrome/photolyase family protein n=1 Tax=Polynucleobacter necessarius TaxID=576610 RepID=UPI0022B263DF|nr:cryptochrome/photolyase family protein [Polynucleobacter necessarius]
MSKLTHTTLVKQPERFILILGDQLDLRSAAFRDLNPQSDEIIMIESANEAQYVLSHKAKIALFLSAMRHFACALEKQGYPLVYIQNSPLPIIEAIKEQSLEKKVGRVVCIEPGEWRLKRALEELAQGLSIDLDMREDEHFYCPNREFIEWAQNKKEFRLWYFYRLMRKRHNVLVDKEVNPEGGQWNFDQDNRKPFPKKDPASLMLQPHLKLTLLHKKYWTWCKKSIQITLALLMRFIGLSLESKRYKPWNISLNIA